MHQVEEVSLPVTINGTLLKSECIEQPPLTHTPISLTESAVAPPSGNVPIAPAPPLSTSTPTSAVKKARRVRLFVVVDHQEMMDDLCRDFGVILIVRRLIEHRLSQ